MDDTPSISELLYSIWIFVVVVLALGLPFMLIILLLKFLSFLIGGG